MSADDTTRGPKPLHVRVDGCSGKKCRVRDGQAVKVEIDFESNQDSESIYFDSTVDIEGIPFPLPYVEHDGCLGIEPACPIKKGVKYLQSYIQKIPKNNPVLKNAKVTVFAKGDKGKFFIS